MDHVDVLAVLKGLGFLLAAASSAWALSRKLSIEDASGGKRLTRAGWLAIIFIVASAALGLVAFDQENRKRLEDARSAQARDAHRLKQIIVSGQPLTNLHLSWQFSGVSESVHKGMAEAVEQTDHYYESDNMFSGGGIVGGAAVRGARAMVSRHKQLYPFLNAITTSNWSDDDDTTVVALIALDDGASTLLPFGRILYKPTVPADPAPERRHRHYYKSDSTKAAAAGIEFDSDMIELQRYGGNQRQRGFPFSGGHPSLHRTSDGYSIEWDISAAQLDESIDRIRDGTNSAKLPDAVRILILYDLWDLPAEPSNFAKPKWSTGYFGDPNAFEPSQTPVEVPFAKSTLTLTPNGIGDVRAIYDVVPIQAAELRNDIDPSLPHYYCKVLALLGTRRPD